MLQRVAVGVPIRFSHLFAAVASCVEVVVTFLALLELIRLKQVRAVQKNIFAEIEIAAAAACQLSIMPRILIAGCGYVGQATADLFHAAGWTVEGWTRSADSAAKLS